MLTHHAVQVQAKKEEVRRKLKERRVPSSPIGRVAGFAQLGASLVYGTVADQVGHIEQASTTFRKSNTSIELKPCWLWPVEPSLVYSTNADQVTSKLSLLGMVDFKQAKLDPQISIVSTGKKINTCEKYVHGDALMSMVYGTIDESLIFQGFTTNLRVLSIDEKIDDFAHLKLVSCMTPLPITFQNMKLIAPAGS